MPGNPKTTGSFPDREPLWYKDAIIYQLHVRAFHDSNGDGIGDFAGLREKLDYLQDLGVTAVWLLPFYPSPLRDDGYDTANYEDVHPDYGTLQDFKAFLHEAHRRGIRVITELVVNHTSDQHPWFQRARRAPKGSPLRDFYVWSDTQERYAQTRIIFKDFEPSNWSWDPVAEAFYWHRFYAHQPDLNFDNPEVHKAVFKALDFWLAMGVDGLRLDAVPYLYEREGTSCENLPETHEFLRKLRAHVDEKFEGRMLLAEANQWPEDAVAYFGAGDECHMAFHFPLMPRLFMAIRMEDRFPIVDILQQTPPIPATSQWALFLRNHDELTLEMVTDEDRDYMYRVYAPEARARINLGIRRRLAPLLGNERRKMELMNGLLFSMPGTPILYYGDEIGMGDNIYLGDRNGVRTPMQWSADRNAGFSRANPQRLYLPAVIDPEYHYESINVEAMQNNPHSLLWWTKRMIALRKRYRAFGHGTIEFLAPENPKVLAFVREWREERLLVIANLSRFTQYTKLDLSGQRGLVPVELFGRSPFPPIGEPPYFFTLGPHTFYWFALEPERVEIGAVEPAERAVPALVVEDDWTEALRGKRGAPVEDLLPEYLRARRWFGGKGRPITSARIVEAVPLARTEPPAQLTLVRVEYTEGEPEHYTLPLAWAEGEEADRLREQIPRSLVARLRVRRGSNERDGVLYDPMADPRFSAWLFEAIAKRRGFEGAHGEIAATPTTSLRKLLPDGAPPPAKPLDVEQSNTSVRFGDAFIFKLYRRVDAGLNPDLEIGRFLTERARFPHVPSVAGAVEYRTGRGDPWTLGILQSLVASEADAWRFTLEALGRYFDRVLGFERDASRPDIDVARRSVVRDTGSEPPAAVREALGTYGPLAALLGERTAQLHLALASDGEDPAFAPEAPPPHHPRSLYQSMRSVTRKGLRALRQALPDLPAAVREDAQAVLDAEAAIDDRIKTVLELPLTAKRIRCHGDFHLGQVLYTGKDFVIIDFEGEPARSIGERRLKRSALRDVAGMLRSFDYASVFALHHSGRLRPEDASRLTPWAAFWCHWASVAYLRAYLREAAGAAFLPKGPEELEPMLGLYLIEKAFYELRYEIHNRPDWVRVPLNGLRQLLGMPVGTGGGLDPAAIASASEES